MTRDGFDKTLDPFAPKAGDRVGHYEILEPIGNGGMGEVFLARDTLLNRDAALKFLSFHNAADSEALLRFEREAQAAAGINHPNIVQVYGAGEHKGYRYLAMEYINGKPLSNTIAVGAFSLGQVLKLGYQLAGGLAEAHSAGVIHRDIKPSNIVLDHHGAPKILDFGLAICINDKDDLNSISPLGTIGYMSPEQVQGKSADHRSDLFSLGVLLYELVTGVKPFTREDASGTLKAILQEVQEPLGKYQQGVTPGLEQIVDKLLEKNPDTRYQSAEDLIADIRRELRALDESTGTPWRRSSSPGRGLRRWSRVLSAAASVAVVGTALAAMQLWDRDSSAQAVDSKNRIMVMGFSNLADPEDEARLGDIAADLLITGLSESQSLQVCSRRHVQDLQRHSGKSNPESWGALARRAQAGWLLTGSILQTEPVILVTAQLVDVETGDVRASERLEGLTGETIFDIVDQLAMEFWAEMVVPGREESRADVQLAKTTTQDPQAYKLYLEGMDQAHVSRNDEAVETLKKAVLVDPEFTMAYVSLAQICNDMGHIDEARKCSEEAWTRIEKAGWKQERLIRSIRAQLDDKKPLARKYLYEVLERHPQDIDVLFRLANLYQGEDDSRALAHYQRVIDLDPYYKSAYNQMALAYRRLGDKERELWAVRESEKLPVREPLQGG